MKKIQKMSSILVFTLVSSSLMGGVLTSTQTFADSNPFSEGVGTVRLSQADKTDLLQYVDSSKSQLQKALEKGRGKSFSEANVIYLEAIKSIVSASFETKPRSELLMRMALNQALELTVGLPESAKGPVVRPGVLQGQGNPDLITVILEESIRMGIHFAQDDRIAIQNGSLDSLPYLQFAVDHLGMGIVRLNSVLDPAVQYRFSVGILQQLMNTLVADSQLHRTILAEELIQIDALLESNPQDKTYEPADLMAQVRVLRAELKKLLTSLYVKTLSWKN